MTRLFATSTPVRRALSRAPSPQDAHVERTQVLLEELAATEDQQRRIEIEAEVADLNLSLAYRLADRYQNRGITLDDLHQVACVGLVKAMRGFDPSRGLPFPAFAVPTIRGELRRHFRDAGWMVRPPRNIQELQSRVTVTREELSQTLRRPPSPRELAEHLGEPLPTVIEALSAEGCFKPTSLDHPRSDEHDDPLTGVLGTSDRSYEAFEARHIVASAMSHLSERDRLIVRLRFERDLSQREIGEVIGVTQMQVSRLLNRILKQLRDEVGPIDAA